jgi:hypothetical protein
MGVQVPPEYLSKFPRNTCPSSPGIRNNTDEDTLNQILDEVSHNLVTAMESACYKCSEDCQECEVIVTITEEDSECTVEFVSACPDCVERIAEDIINLEEFEVMTKDLERSKVS